MKTIQNDLYQVTEDGRLQFHFHQGQLDAWNCPKRFVLVLAGTQGGKTSFGPIWLWREMQQRGPGDYIVAAPTFPLLELKLLPEFKRLFEDLLHAGRYVASPTRKFTLSPEGERRLWGEEQATPTHVYFGHAQDPDSLESATAKGAWLDEAGQRKFKRGSFEAILRRLSLHEGRVLITTTPYYHGWLKKELHDPGLAGDPDIGVIRFESRMNPLFSRNEWDRAQRTLPSWRFDMFYRALFTKPAGLIYDAFEEDEHTITPFSIPTDWVRAWGFDFGAVNLACSKYAIHPHSGRLILYDAYKGGGRTAAQHAELLLTNDEYPYLCMGGAWSEDNWRDEFTAAGLPIERPPIKDVEVGIERVYGVIKTDRMRVFSNLDEWLDEIRTYSRKLDDDHNPLEDIEDKNKYHLLDSTRYIIAGLEQASELADAETTLAMLQATQ